MNPGPATNLPGSRPLQTWLAVGAGALVLFGGPLLLVLAVLLLITQLHGSYPPITPHALLLATLSVVLYLATFTALSFGVRKLRTGSWIRTAEEQQRRSERSNSKAWTKWKRVGTILVIALDCFAIGMLVWVKSRNPHLNMTVELAFPVLALLVSACVFVLAHSGKASSGRLSIRP